MQVILALSLAGSVLAHSPHHARHAHVARQAPTPTVPELAAITSGMPTQTLIPLATTYTAGATPPVSGAPPLPSAFTYVAADWPTPDKHVEDLTSPDVIEWMKELDGKNIPDIAPSTDGTCAGSPANAAMAASIGWWTCAGVTRNTDIVNCPDKMTWGLSFDDGPSEFTPGLLNYLTDKNLHATFFVVGSRCVYSPETLRAEYMQGHEISVHTWSHPYLTSMSNAQIVAELGWTRKAIQAITGVTPTTMRPPYGDIDDRVRAIAMAMGLTPIIWSRSNAGLPYDTNDWKVAGGMVSGTDQMATFEGILDSASSQSTGFVVLAHDLFEITVELAIGYTIPAAQSHSPPFLVEPIGQCNKLDATSMYKETTKLTSDVAPAAPAGDSIVSGTPSGASSSAGTAPSSTAPAGASSSGAVATTKAATSTKAAATSAKAGQASNSAASATPTSGASTTTISVSTVFFLVIVSTLAALI